MADEKNIPAAPPAPPPEPKKEVPKADRSKVVKAQANYKGNEHSDLVTVKIIKDGNHVKAGQTKVVHPAMAQILKAKGLIDNDGKPYTRPKFDQKDITVDV